jgi:hypothetical protein
MACTSKIGKVIVSDCSTMGVGGNEIKAWIFNRSEATITYDNTYPSKVTGIVFAQGKRAWTVTGVKKLLNSGFSRVIAEDRPDKYKQWFKFQAFSFAASDNENLDSLSDVVVIVESKDKNDDGTFRIYGLKSGLYPNSDEHDANGNNGARVISLESMAGQEEPNSVYVFDAGSYAQSAAALLAMETPAS